jgi:hypothetical protein
MKLRSLIMRMSACGLMFAGSGFSSVTIYPAPSGMELSYDYQVFVNGTPVDVYRIPVSVPRPGEDTPTWWSYNEMHHGAYSMAYFDFSDSVTVKITSVGSATILPIRYNNCSHFSGDTLIIVLKQPGQISIEPSDRGPLALFANPPEVNPPHEGDPGVIYYGPGIHTGDLMLVSRG